MQHRIHFKNISLILIGSAILAFGLYNFNFQNNVTEGGILGFILLIKALFDISPSITSFILDASLFLIGIRYFGKRFMIYSFIATISFSVFYAINERIGFTIPNLSNHMLLAAILGGIFVGIGVGLIVRTGGAAGGDDVIALLVDKYTRFTVGHTYLALDLLVLILSLTYLTVGDIFWSILTVIVSGQIINLLYYKKD